MWGAMPEQLLPFILTSLLIELTPGPNMAYLAVLSVDRGRTAGLAAVAGVALGLLVLGLVAGLGGATLISETRWLYEAVRWGGALFLLWLAWDCYREARKPIAAQTSAQRLGSYFGRGLVTNLLNPKAAAFYVAVMPNFISADQPTLPQAVALTLSYATVATIVHGLIVVLGGTLQPLFTSPDWRRRLGIVFGLLLVAVAVWLAVTTHRVW
jgi:threonine/homoserine/homoserine lactone efflux protein